MRAFAVQLLLPLGALSLTGCFLPGCTLKRGLGAASQGEVAAGAHGWQVLDLRPGAQNDVYVTPRDSMTTGTTYTVYVTSAACTEFKPNAPRWELRYPVIPQDPCAVIASDTLKRVETITSFMKPRMGPGAHVMVRDHEVAGDTRFKLWVIGDPRAPTAYNVRIDWASGHDC